MKKRASGVVRGACCLVVVTRRAILSLSKEKKERERLPDDAAAAAAVKAALFMTSFGLGGLEGPDPRGGRQSDGQTGGRADGQTLFLRRFLHLCLPRFLPSLQVDNFSESREKRGKSHKKRRLGGKWKAESHK